MTYRFPQKHWESVSILDFSLIFYENRSNLMEKQCKIMSFHDFLRFLGKSGMYLIHPSSMCTPRSSRCTRHESRTWRAGLSMDIGASARIFKRPPLRARRRGTRITIFRSTPSPPSCAGIQGFSIGRAEIRCSVPKWWIDGGRGQAILCARGALLTVIRNGRARFSCFRSRPGASMKSVTWTHPFPPR